MKHIKISKPCHENWNEFTPTQKGAFCGKCQIDVIDFTTKSNSEIKDILENKTNNHMCGRFSNNQLQNFNTDYALWQNQSQSTFQSKFIFAIILGFGLTLFSCENSSDLSQISSFSTNVEIIKNNLTTNTIEDTIINSDTLTTLIDSVEISPVCPPPPADVPIDYDIMGDIVYIETTVGIVDFTIPEPTDTIKEEAVIIEKDSIIEPPIKFNHPIIMGKFEIQSPPTKDTKQKDNTNCSSKTIQATCSPNPTTGKAKLTIEVTKKAFYSVKILNEQGQIVETVCNKTLEKGLQSLRINIGNQKNGLYLIQIENDLTTTSLKIIKT